VGVEKMIIDQRALMDEFDARREVGLILDEWGTWHPPTPGREPNHLWQQNTMRDALVAAISLDAFNRQADKLVMANIAQAVNVLQALFLTEAEELVLTPTYHVFEMYKEHQGGRGVRVEIESDNVAFAVGDERRTMRTLAGSMSIKGNVATLSVTNTHARHAVEAEVDWGGLVVKEVDARVMGHEDIHAHNTFENPAEVTPREGVVGKGRWVFPAASVTVIRARI
jgi:alpha-N-arabinofuranosidase